MTKKMLLLLALLLLCQPDGVRARRRHEQPDRQRTLGADQRRFLDGDRFRPVRSGAGQGRRAAAEGMARNPGAAAAIRFALLLGLVLIESLALYTLVIIFVKVG